MMKKIVVNEKMIKLLYLIDEKTNYKICIDDIIHFIIYVKFKLKNILFNVKKYNYEYDDYYLIVAYKNNEIIDYLYYDFDFIKCNLMHDFNNYNNIIDIINNEFFN